MQRLSCPLKWFSIEEHTNTVTGKVQVIVPPVNQPKCGKAASKMKPVKTSEHDSELDSTSSDEESPYVSSDNSVRNSHNGDEG
jgi:broad specificity polyphosphatase/5'/3'-nucleotidase SurE